MNNIGFDNEKYLKEQSQSILERAQRFGDKLYLEFGGKMLFDYHASRVLPGFDPNVKMRLLQEFNLWPPRPGHIPLGSGSPGMRVGVPYCSADATSLPSPWHPPGIKTSFH